MKQQIQKIYILLKKKTYSFQRFFYRELKFFYHNGTLKYPRN